MSKLCARLAMLEANAPQREDADLKRAKFVMEAIFDRFKKSGLSPGDMPAFLHRADSGTLSARDVELLASLPDTEAEAIRYLRLIVRVSEEY